MNIDLTHHIIEPTSGNWERTPGRLTLAKEGDSVTLTGFLRVRITFELVNVTISLSDFARIAPRRPTPPPIFAGPTPPPVAAPAPAATTATQLLEDGSGFFPQYRAVYSYVLTIPAGQFWPYTLSLNNVRN